MSRKDLEAEFHSLRESDRNTMSDQDFLRKYPNKSFYCINKKIEDFRESMVKNNADGAVILDYCCGLGQASRRFAKYNAKKVYGIDIATEEVATAKKNAEKDGLKNVEFIVMDAEEMTFPDETFDIVVCNGVLHHLNVEKAYKEISRVLKPGGIMVANEALGYNPVIQMYRRMTPSIRTAWETDHILTMKQVNQAKEFFVLEKIKFFYLFSILAIPFRKMKIFKPLLALTSVLDSIILKVPLFRLMAWQMVFVMKKS
ncbi:MAG: class I SAM-dependent methyltransferase [Coxiellaceae bacterium]|nr:class I SAM-dependent methyltransferase [Coxiellaceae bacterium]MDF1865544.1 class I SAM-dependent methyltransferase [Saprospiraceae bacterium]